MKFGSVILFAMLAAKGYSINPEEILNYILNISHDGLKCVEPCFSNSDLLECIASCASKEIGAAASDVAS